MKLIRTLSIGASLCCGASSLAPCASDERAVTSSVEVWVAPEAHSHVPCGSSVQDACTLAAAVSSLRNMAANRTASLLLLSGQYILRNHIEIRHSHHINIQTAPGQPNLAVLSPDPSSPSNSISLRAPSTKVQDIVLSHYFTSAILIEPQNMHATFRNVTFKDNWIIQGVGSAVSATLNSSATLEFVDCLFLNNTVADQVDSSSAGAVSVRFASETTPRQLGAILFTRTRFESNRIVTVAPAATVPAGGAVQISLSSPISPLNSSTTLQQPQLISFSDCSFIGNEIDISGDVQTMNNNPELIVTHGGALSIESSAGVPTNLTLSNCTFEDNALRPNSLKAHSVSGGACWIKLDHSRSEVFISDSQFNRNRAVAGAAPVLAPVETNAAGSCQGGALSVLSFSTATLQNCRFTSNVCYGGDGGLYSGDVAAGALYFSTPKSSRLPPSKATNVGLKIVDCQFNSNGCRGGNAIKLSSTSMGGAIFVGVSSLSHSFFFEVFNSSFENNYSPAICNGDSSSIGGAVALEEIQHPPLHAHKFSRPIRFENCTFIKNSAICLSGASTNPVKGGAISIRVQLFRQAQPTVSNCTFRENIVDTNNAMAQTVARGGALFIEDQTGSGIRVESCRFFNNSARSSVGADGGAINFPDQSSNVLIADSEFYQNSAICSHLNYDTGKLFCAGGAVHAQARKATILRSNFEENFIFSIVACQKATGAAYFTQTSPEISQSKFIRNYILGDIVEGGAIASFGGICNECLFDGNYVEGTSGARGGSWFFYIEAVKFQSTTFLNGYSLIVPPQKINEKFDVMTCRRVDAMPDLFAFERWLDLDSGGAIFFTLQNDITMVDVKFQNLSSNYGGAIVMSSEMGRHLTAKVHNVTFQSCHAHTAGGAFFLSKSCEARQVLQTFCQNESISFSNCSSASYGPQCASHPEVLLLQQNLREHNNAAAFVAPGEKLSVTLHLRDAADNVVTGLQQPLTVALNNNNDNNDALILHSGVARDSIFSDEHGFYRFNDIVLESKPNNTASLAFSVAAFKVCREDLIPQPTATANFTIRTTHCLPSYFSSASSSTGPHCERCPANTYRLSVESHACIPCSAEFEHEDSNEGSECLKTNGNEHWVVAEGFYPVPSLDEPTELLRCPNEACRSINCSVYVQEHDLHWRLNCSAAQGEICEEGYEGRLCSRCECNSHHCYFASGEAEERECILCREPSTAVITIAVATLQLSLVVFLLFKRSALALLLSESAIVIILILLGIGEFWMFDLVVILGLLFIITSLSQKLPKQNKKVKKPLPFEEEEEEEQGEGSHHEEEHKIAARTSAQVKVIIFFFQTTATVVASSAWPKWMVAFVHQLNSLNLRVSGLECFATGVFSIPTVKISLQLAMPWILGLSLAFAAIIAMLLVKLNPVVRIKQLISRCKQNNRRRRGGRSFDDDGMAEDVSSGDRGLVIEKTIIDNDVDAEKAPLLAPDHSHHAASEEWSVGQILIRMQFSFLFLISASYFELSNVVLEILRPCAKGHMASFPWISCTEPGHFTTMFAIGVAFLIIYTFGIPMFFGAIMFCNRRRIVSGDPNMEARYGFLFESYRPNVFWWELVWFLRRILLSTSVTILVSLQGYRIALVSAVLIGSIFLHRAVMPFVDRTANFLDLSATACILFSVIVGSEVEHLQSVDHNMASLLQNVVFVANLCVAVALVVALSLPAVKSVYRSFSHKFC